MENEQTPVISPDYVEGLEWKIRDLEDEIEGLKMLLQQAENAAGLYMQRAEEAEKECRNTNREFLG